MVYTGFIRKSQVVVKNKNFYLTGTSIYYTSFFHEKRSGNKNRRAHVVKKRYEDVSVGG